MDHKYGHINNLSQMDIMFDARYLTTALFDSLALSPNVLEFIFFLLRWPCLLLYFVNVIDVKMLVEM